MPRVNLPGLKKAPAVNRLAAVNKLAAVRMLLVAGKGKVKKERE